MKTAERTIERPHVERQDTSQGSRGSLIAAIAAVAALMAGILLGFLIWGGDDSSSPAAVVVDGAELTARQEQMVELINEGEAAWQRGDRAAIVDMFTEDGTLTVFGTEFEGPMIAEGVTTQPSLDVLEPMLFDDTRVLTFHYVAGFGTLVEVFEFTETGEVLIVSHEILR